MKAKVIFLLLLYSCVQVSGQDFSNAFQLGNQNQISGIVHVKVKVSDIEVDYQNKNYRLLIFNDSAKFYLKTDSLKKFQPAFILPDTANDGNYIGFYDAENNLPVIIASYRNKKLDGLIKQINFNGMPIMVADYSSGKENGFVFFYDGQGNLLQLDEFKDGMKHGYSLSFFDPSHPSILCRYKDNQLDGEFKQWGWDMNNRYILTKHLIYQNGKVVKLYK